MRKQILLRFIVPGWLVFEYFLDLIKTVCSLTHKSHTLCVCVCVELIDYGESDKMIK